MDKKCVTIVTTALPKALTALGVNGWWVGMDKKCVTLVTTALPKALTALGVLGRPINASTPWTITDYDKYRSLENVYTY